MATATETTIAPLPFATRIEAIRADLQRRLLGRDVEIAMIMLSLFSMSNFAALGPPGTAKSLLNRLLLQYIADGTSFSWQLSRYTRPSDIFGGPAVTAMMDIQREDPASLIHNYRGILDLEDAEGRGRGEFADLLRAAIEREMERFRGGGVDALRERDVTGKLPEAHIAHLDEFTKASGATMNALLSVANRGEREFEGKPLPLLSVIGTGNELPPNIDSGFGGVDNLAAFWDRFHIRMMVDYLPDALRQKLIDRGAAVPPPTPRLSEIQISPDESRSFRAYAEKRVKWSGKTLRLYDAAIVRARRNGIAVSDRKAAELKDIFSVWAMMNGSREVAPIHLRPLRHMLWNKPEQIGKVVEICGAFAPASHAVADRCIAEMREAASSALSVLDDESFSATGDTTNLEELVRILETNLAQLLDIKNKMKAAKGGDPLGAAELATAYSEGRALSEAVNARAEAVGL
jgi:MoxR-like ATPase